MSIDMDINELFSEKNQQIFLNKLLLDLGNNTESFKITTKHIVMVEIAKLLSSLKRVYDKYSIEYDEKAIKKVLSETKSNLLEDINVLIEEKKEINSSFVDNSQQKKINKTYLKDYHKNIDESESSFEGSVKLSVQEHTEIYLYNKLINLYPCCNEEMQQDIMQIINVECCHTIISRVIDEGRHRSMTLKNMSGETYEKYLELSKCSSQSPKPQKVKIKTDN